jgi:hypothetical protein
MAGEDCRESVFPSAVAIRESVSRNSFEIVVMQNDPSRCSIRLALQFHEQLLPATIFTRRWILSEKLRDFAVVKYEFPHAGGLQRVSQS